MSLILQAALFVMFAGLTVGLITQKKRYFSYHLEVWRKLAIGLVFLDIASLLFLIDGLGYSGDLPIIRNDFLRFSLQSLTVIAGALLTFAGLAEWIPSLIKSGRGRERLGVIVDLISGMQRTVENWTDPDREMFVELARQINEFLKPDSGLLVRVNGVMSDNLSVLRLSDQAVVPHESISGIDEIERALNKREFKYVCDMDVSTKMIETLGMESIGCGALGVFPITARGRLYGVLVAGFEDPDDFTSNDAKIAHFGFDALASTIQASSFRGHLVNLISSQDSLVRLQKLAAKSTGIDTFLSDAFALVTGLLPSDMISVAVLEENGTNMKRYSLSESSNVISEVGMSLPLSRTVVQEVIRTCRHDIAVKLSGLTFSDDAWLTRCGFDSRLTAPIAANGKPLGTISFISLERGKYSPMDLANAEIIATVFAEVINLVNKQNEISSRLSCMRDASVITRRYIVGGDSGSFLSGITMQAVEGLPATECRILSYDRSANRVRCIGIHSRREYNEREILGEAHGLDGLRKITSAVRVGEPVIIRAEEGDSISGSEMSILSSFAARTIIIVPLVVRSSLEGFMVISEGRSWERRPFDRNDLSLILMLATQFSVFFGMMSGEPRVSNRLTERIRESRTDSVDHFAYTDVRRKMKDPLTSILGAAELLESGLAVADSPMSRYVRTIRRNADKMAKTFNNYDEYVNANR